MKIRTGLGFDVHALIAGRKFCLGGIVIPHEKGADGHSDADVLIHAICDALLGAANLRDIGFHFSNSDPKYKNVDSKILLREVMDMLLEKNWKIGNIDATVVLEEPKINPFIPEMKKAMAGILQISEEDISIKATTNESMGFVGRKEGISAYASCLIINQ